MLCVDGVYGVVAVDVAVVDTTAYDVTVDVAAAAVVVNATAVFDTTNVIVNVDVPTIGVVGDVALDVTVDNGGVRVGVAGVYGNASVLAVGYVGASTGVVVIDIAADVGGCVCDDGTGADVVAIGIGDVSYVADVYMLTVDSDVAAYVDVVVTTDDVLATDSVAVTVTLTSMVADDVDEGGVVV